MRAEGTPGDRGSGGGSSDEEDEALLAALAQQADAFGTPISLAAPSPQGWGQQAAQTQSQAAPSQRWASQHAAQEWGGGSQPPAAAGSSGGSPGPTQQVTLPHCCYHSPSTWRL